MFNSGDILLFAISARRTVSWPVFKQWFEEVHRKENISDQVQVDEPAPSARWQALRIMSCLGHVDLHFGQDEIQVVVAPPVLAALPERGVARAVLCGARSPSAVEKLQEAATAAGVEDIVGLQVVSSPYMPTRVELRAENPCQIHDVAASVGLRYIDFPPARLLARRSISLQEYRRSLVWSKEADLNWRREDYDTDRLRFLPSGETSPLIRLSRYQDPVTSIWRNRLWRNGEWAEVDLDWGRYAILALSSRRVLKYDLVARIVCVPYGAPLPTLLARSFGLCSGQCSTLFERVSPQAKQRYYEFGNVPPSVYNAVANNLLQ